ncbi:ribonuclease J [Kordiimonas marina]|uniref:ribonuclease J n=1 Tax=Kordiimonas marina TaxID=2872312 RepID=UPI001FF6654F|nr:ribonuclease J [Kordiimonas marina]MCJ9428741.1 ribonuclease J [Kordiimonas marina]
MAYLRERDERLLFLPLGGSGEIGMNLNLYGHKGKWLMVDCGMTFAETHVPGIDLIFPDPAFIESEREDLVGLVLTHGHEDHIGAVPYLWSRLKCPVYATPFTAELVKDKLKEAGLLDVVPLHVVDALTPIEIGPYTVSYVPLAHSIAEGHGLVIETGEGTIFHTGDWKLDDRPLIGPVCPSPVLSELGDKGVLALVGDSTNVFNPNESGSEAAVRESLVEIVKELENRVVITTFASNVARLETIGAVAKASGRHLVLLGRSMERVVRAAKATGYLQDFPPLVPEEDADHLPRNKVLIACTGCQGEPRAAIARIARGDHKYLHLSPEDNVIFSSKIIPGNDLTLGQLFNTLAAEGINVITEKDAFVHVSGHPGRAELAKMYGWTKPFSAIPVHGEARHLLRHAKLARELGVEHTIVPRNGDIIEISKQGLKLVDEAPVGRLALDGTEVINVGDPSIIDRRRASANGFVTVSLVFDDDGALAAEPAFAIMGLPRSHDDAFYDGLVDAVEEALDRMKAADRRGDSMVEETARIAVRRYCRSEIGKNPGVASLITRREDIDFR